MIRPGDDPGVSHTNRSFRWGAQATLTLQRSAQTVIQTPTFPLPVPFLLEVEFPDDSAPFVGVRVTIRRAVDELGSVVSEVFTGSAIPNGVNIPKIVIGHNVGVDVALTDSPIPPGTAQTVKVGCVPMSSADPIELLPTRPAYGAHGGYRTTEVRRIATVVVATLFLPTNVNRRQFFIMNNSAQDLAILFGGVGAVSLAAGAENFSIILPGGTFGHYESPIGGFSGNIQGIWRAADATGEALITEGLTP